MPKRCSILGCVEDGVEGRAVADYVTGRSYYLNLCNGHLLEFDAYYGRGDYNETEIQDRSASKG
jgi:hypothetical protein